MIQLLKKVIIYILRFSVEYEYPINRKAIIVIMKAGKVV